MFPDIVILAEQQPAGHDVFENVGARSGALKREVVEGTLVVVAGLARQPVVDGKVRLKLAAFGPCRSAGNVLPAKVRAEREAAVVVRVVARENGVETIAKGQAVEAGRRRNRRSGQLPPKTRG